MQHWFLKINFTSEKDNQLARILFTLIWASVGIHLLLIVVGLHAQDWGLISVALTSCALLSAPLILLSHQKINASSFIFVLFALATVTAVATVGQGIRDTAVVAFPVVFIFAGLALDKKLFRVCVGLTLAAVCWLVFGETYGWLVTKPFDGIMETWILFMIAIVLLLVAALAVELLVTNMRMNLMRAETEIAQRKQAEASLRKSEEKFRNLFNNSAIGIFHSTYEGKFIDVNPALAKLLGYDTPEEVITSITNIAEQVYVDQPERNAITTTALEAGGLVVSENRYRRKDGSLWYGRLHMRIVPPQQDEPLFYEGFIEDITERKRAEETVLENDLRFRAFVEQAPVSIGVFNLEGIGLYANQKYIEILGLKNANEFVGRAAYEYFAPQYREESKERIRRRLAGLPVPSEYESIAMRSDGVEFPVHLAIAPINLSGKTVSIAFMSDITERKQAEAKLMKSELRYRTLFENATIGIAISDMDEQNILINPVAATVLGIEPGKVPLTALIDSTHPDDQKLETPLYMELMSGKRDYYSLDKRYVRKDGKVTSGHMSLKVLRDQSGAPWYALAFLEDLTERKRMEEELHKSQKLESLGVLAGGIAHDFNNLLGGIYGYIDLAREVNSDEKISRYLSKATTTIERARGLTLQLLTFAKGGLPIKKVGSLFPFVQEAALFALSGSNVSCEFDLQNDLAPCDFDKNQIGQVIDNIIINAKQAMPDGGTIMVSSRNINFTENEHPPLKSGTYIVISITDTGIGIPKNILSRIFDPFYTTKSTGHGLGLATCYSIVNKHGGCIDVKSEPGVGSTFLVFLPASKDFNPSNIENTTLIHTGRGLFLVMDDQEVMRDTIGDMLKSFGYTVVCKENGNEAIEFVASETMASRKIAGMIFDLTIPGGMGGQETIGEVRKLNQKVPVFVMSGYAEDPIMARPTDHGFIASISKPFRKSDLSDMLNKYLNSQN